MVENLWINMHVHEKRLGRWENQCKLKDRETK